MTDEKTFRKTVPAATEVASTATATEPSTVDFAMLEPRDQLKTLLQAEMKDKPFSRGEDLNGFVMDFVYPSIKGPSITGKRVVLLDSWLSEKSYVQTSSLVTLRNGNELSLDFSVVEREGAEVLAVASLIGGVDMIHPTIKVVNPVSGDESELPFIEVYKESELH